MIYIYICIYTYTYIYIYVFIIGLLDFHHHPFFKLRLPFGLGSCSSRIWRVLRAVDVDAKTIAMLCQDGQQRRVAETRESRRVGPRGRRSKTNLSHETYEVRLIASHDERLLLGLLIYLSDYFLNELYIYIYIYKLEICIKPIIWISIVGSLSSSGRQNRIITLWSFVEVQRPAERLRSGKERKLCRRRHHPSAAVRIVAQPGRP